MANETKTINMAAQDINAALDMSLYGYRNFVSMFEKIGVCGDSFTAGSIYYDNQNGEIHEDLSWGKVLGRQFGIDVSVFATPGVTTKTWLSKSLPTLISSEALPCYIINLGINDYNDYTKGIWSLGNLSDIKTDYNDNEDTFYGNYGKIICKIKEHSPNAVIILSKVWPRNNSVYTWSSEAIEKIANKFSLPFIDTAKSKLMYSQFYKDQMVERHPTAPIYAMMASEVAGLIGKCIYDNIEYFKKYPHIEGTSPEPEDPDMTRAKEIAESYTTKLGDSTNKESVTTMLYGLIHNGIYDNMFMLCPMLGTSKEQKTINIINDSYPMMYGGNVVEEGNGYVKFANTKAIGTMIDFGFDVNTMSKRISGKGNYARYYGVNAVSSTSQIAAHQVTSSSSASNYMCINVTAGSMYGQVYDNQCRVTHAISNDAPIRVMDYITIDGEYGLYVNDDEPQSASVVATIDRYTYNNWVGSNIKASQTAAAGTTITASSSLMNGELYMVAFGKLTKEQGEIMKGILDTFLKTVKSNVFA